MRIFTRFFLGLLMTGILLSHSLAQSQSNEDPRNISALITTLDHEIDSLHKLITSLDAVVPTDREFLVYRQDRRVFKLLVDYDVLAEKISQLPQGAEQVQTATEHLTDFGVGLEVALFERIDEIKDKVNGQRNELAGLGGAILVVALADIRSLESIRIKYYEALANHIDSRDLLGLGSQELRRQLGPKLLFYAETLAGRIEHDGAARANVEQRLAMDSQNADIGAALSSIEIRHEINIQRLEAIILILDQLGLDSSQYKAVLLQHSGSFSISFFSSEAITAVVEESWSALKLALKNNAPDLIFRLLMFIAVLLIFRLLSRITRNVVRKATDRSHLDMSVLLKNILISTTGGTVMALGFLIALSQVGISLAPMLAGLGVLGFIVGFALQDSLGNFAAGAMILLYRPYDVDDFIEVAGASGLVKKMNLVSTTILTFDNQTLVVPNSKIWGGVIKNVTAQTERRVDLEFGIGYDDDIELAERVLAEVVAAHEKILTDPEPLIKLHTLGDSSVNFIVRPWTRTENYWDVYWDLMREVKLRFDREGISIPYPQRDVHLYSEKDT